MQLFDARLSGLIAVAGLMIAYQADRPEDTGGTSLLSFLFLIVVVDNPVAVNLENTDALGASTIRLNLNVVDAREDFPALDVRIETVSRFTPVQP